MVNFEHVFVSWAQDKFTKQLKCTLNNRVVSLEYVHVK